MKKQGCCARLSSYLDRFVRTEIYVGRQPHSAFRLCGYVGLITSLSLALALVAYQHLSLWIMFGVITTAAVSTFLALAMLTKIILGEERLIYYHHEIAIMVVTALGLWLLGQPVLTYLDITILGIGAFLACGRIGCLMVGCCHGRPHRFGVCYREEHAQAGFTHYYVGIPLFPIQLLESLWVTGIVVIGVDIILHHYPPGTALAWYIISYDLGRFFFEFLRGDPLRSYLLGFSEAQWTSVLLLVAVVAGEFYDLIPFSSWHVWATAGIILVMVVTSVMQGVSRTSKYRLLNPRHVREIAQAVQTVAKPAGALPASNNGGSPSSDINVRITSQGLCISAGRFAEGSSNLQHYSLSCQRSALTAATAEIISGVILTTSRHSFDSKELIKGKDGVYHLLLHDSMTE
jgi:hypothetical protein